MELVGGIVLFLRERHEDKPLIPIDLQRIPVIGLSVATSICSFAAYMLAFLALPFWFQAVLQRDQVQTGLLMTPSPVGLGLMATLPADAASIAILWRMAPCGAGFGFFQATNNRTLLGSAPRERGGRRAGDGAADGHDGGRVDRGAGVSHRAARCAAPVPARRRRARVGRRHRQSFTVAGQGARADLSADQPRCRARCSMSSVMCRTSSLLCSTCARSRLTASSARRRVMARRMRACSS